MAFISINRNPYGTIFCQQIPENNQSFTHQRQPDGVFQTIIVMFERIARIVGRIDIDTFDGTRIVLFEGFEGKQIVAMDEHIAVPRFAIGQGARLDRTIRIVGILNENPRFNRLARIILSNPRQFQFLQFLILCHCYRLIFC